MEWYDIIREVALAPKMKLATLILSGVVIFAPEPILKVAGAQSLVDQYRTWVGLAFLISGALLLADVIIDGPGWAISHLRRIQKNHASEKSRKMLVDQLESLTDGELAIVNNCLARDNASVSVPSGLPVQHEVLTLCGKGILVRWTPASTVLSQRFGRCSVRKLGPERHLLRHAKRYA